MQSKDKKYWTQITVEDFCSHRILEDYPEKKCQGCGDVSMFWVDDMGGILCIECAHSFYCDLMHEEHEHYEELRRTIHL